MSRRALLALWLPPLLYLGLIFTLSGMPHPPIPKGVSGNLLHYPEYAVLGFLLARAVQGEDRGAPGIAVLLIALALSAFFGATDEVHQAFVPGRVPDVWDWVRDCAGAAAGALSWRLWRHLRA